MKKILLILSIITISAILLNAIPLLTEPPPTLVSPANKSYNVPLTGSFTWEPVTGADSYYIQVSNMSDFNDRAIIISDSTTEPVYNYSDVFGGYQWYFWRVSAHFSSGQGPWSDTWFFMTENSIPVVTTTAPTTVTTNSAQSGGNVTSDCGSPITRRGIVFSIAPTVPTISNNNGIVSDVNPGVGAFKLYMFWLKPSTNYIVRAYATNSLGTGYGDSYTFTTLDSIPAPILISPANETYNVPLSTSFTWNAVPGADYYHIQLSKYADFNLPFLDAWKIPDTTFYYTGGLDSNQIYRWRVSAHTVNGWTVFSDTWRFSTGLLTPTVITTTPSEITSNSTQTGGDVTKDGGSPITARGVFYTLFPKIPTINNSSTITNPDNVLGSFSSTITGLEQNTAYIVRAFATNIIGTSYGSSVTFTTKITKPTLLIPLNNATGIQFDGILSWDPVIGATDYHLQLSTDMNFGTTVIDSSGYISSDYNYSGLLNNQLYYWKVAGNNANGQGDWSDIWNFTTENQISVKETNEQTLLNIRCNPNPISTEAYFNVNLPVSSNVTLKLFNSLGMNIETLIDNYMESGTFNIKWNPNKLNLPNGIYFCVIRAGNNNKVIPLIYYKK